MLRLPRLFAVMVALSLVLGRAPTARAWIETRVESSSTWIELESDGSATVRHELWLSVRGAPLRSFSLEGIDSDARPLPDATLTRMKGDVATSQPLPVQLTATAGRLDVEVPLQRGFRGRTFLLKLGYRTQLLTRGLIRPLRGGGAELAWFGPRYDDGVDSVALTVRAPAGAHPPEVMPIAPANAAEPAANYGIVMSTLRRSRHRDELELVRAHVARGEAMTWRVRLDADLFPVLRGEAETAPPRAPRPSETGEPLSPGAERMRLSPPPYQLGLGGLLYALLVWLKAWQAARASAARGCRPRALVAWRAPARAGLAGLCLLGAAVLSLYWDAPLAAALALLAALAFATERSPQHSPAPRGPGAWRVLESTALRPRPAAPLPGAWLDAGRPRGFVILLGLLGMTTWCASLLYASSPHLGACTLLASSAWLPIFCTGRAGQLPLDALAYSRRFLRRTERRLSRTRQLLVTPMGRFAAASDELDELRLAIAPERGAPGLIGMELGLSFKPRLGGYCAEPVVIVRAAEGSPCQRALARSLSWTRGRTDEERAALVRPRLPTARETAALVQELLAVMTSAAAPVAVARKSTKSAGKGLSTSKRGSRSSPAHAT